MSTPATTLAALTAGLVDQLAAAGHVVPEPPAAPTTPDEAAKALVSLAGQTRVSLFSVWCAEDEEGVNAGVSFFFLRPDAPGDTSLLGQDRAAVRVAYAPDLHAPLGEALARLGGRGHDEDRPQRGTVAFPFGAGDDAERLFWMTFQDGPLGPWVTAVARDRRLRADQPPFSSLPLSPDDAAFLEARFRTLDALFHGQPVLFTGARGTGRSTTLHAAMGTLPDGVNALAALEQPRSVDVRVGTVRVGPSAPLSQLLRAFLRQDPDVVFADEARTPEDLRMLIQSAFTGHAVAFALEAATPEEVLARLGEAFPGVPLTPLIVHHAVDATTGARALTVHTVTRDGAGHARLTRAAGDTPSE
ncbi:Flp pilus assembly complex ATPase component TadA [Myxococcus sp. K15C18031901]|uniref:ATPase, T2SS/T4P/T4SS family n=1 Tax=Myxococcus dinghuensis TaxID=2906761 RepID=UPI0020A76466|nr:ATPase, T2SS/T4P/T4SS family [Myxococcus dinghuensis]MCP3101058.1 Flp pilus assembly complex ATPase component TadA [Myxococcus dinghuensis]